MRVFIILGFLVAASTAAIYGPTQSPILIGTGSTLVDTIGLSGTGGLSGVRYGNGLISSGSGLIGNVNSGLINTGGYGGLIGSRYGSGLIGGRLISTGNRGLISTGGYGGGIIGNGGLISSGIGGISGGRLINGGTQIISGGGRLINGGTQIISGGGQLIGGGTRIIDGGAQIIGGGSQLIGGGISTGTTNVIGIPSLDSIPQTVEYSKQFFHFEAPEEHQEEGTITKQLSNVLKKNLQVVFIKAPENNAATNAALQLAKQAIEQKTDIYVLSKQNDGAQLVGQLQQIQESVPTVPEVRIVKYRTPQDLAYAKEVIQTEYETTGGSSQSFDGGVAPVLNYASGVSSLSSGGALLGSSLGTGLGTGLVSGLGSSLGSTNIVGGGSVIGSGLGTTTYVDNGSLLGSGIGTTKIIGTGPLLGTSGITTINGALGSNKLTSVNLPVTTKYLPPLKKK